MTTDIHGPAKKFVEFAPEANGWSLDIGAAYGIHTIAAIQNGGRVVANDIDRRHLQILTRQVPAHLQLSLRIRTGSFPNIKLPNGAFGAILASNVMCFMDGRAVERSAERMFNVLAPGGKVFVRTPTPFAKHLSYIQPAYEEKKAAGEKWPGLFLDMDERRPSAVKRHFGGPMHFMVPEQLARVFEEAGFQIEEAEFFSVSPAVGVAGTRPELNGKEWTALIAKKK